MNNKKITSIALAVSIISSNIPVQSFANEIDKQFNNMNSIIEGTIEEPKFIEDSTDETLKNKDKELLKGSSAIKENEIDETENDIESLHQQINNEKIEQEYKVANVITENTYVVSNIDDLKSLRTEINDNNLDTTSMTVELASDIDFSSENEWVAIGTNDNGFKGTFDGKGYTLKNLNLDGVEFEGIFSNTGASTFKNVNIENFSISNSSSRFVGALVGISNNNINFESISLSNININSSNYSIGGLIGFNPNGKITNFTDIIATNIIINGNSSQYVGGLIGHGTINSKNIEASVEIIAPSSYVGGIMGGDGSNMSQSLVFEDIVINVALQGNATGGLIGYCTCNTIDIKNVSITGEYINSSGQAGGLVGYLTTGTDLEDIDMKIKRISGYTTGGLIGTFSATQPINLNNIDISSVILGIENAGGVIANAYASNKMVGQNIKIKETIIESENYSAGISAYNNTLADLSNLNLDVVISGKEAVGGVFGNTTNFVKIEDSKIKANIESQDYSGGLIGYSMTNFTAINNNLDVNINGNNQLGGIVGRSTPLGDVSILDNTIHITIENGKDDIGGLIGSTYSDKFNISNNIVNCNLAGENNIGGLIGNGIGSIINNNKISGNINGNNNIGGLAGRLLNSMEKLISKNDIRVNLAGDSYVGGIAGYSFGLNCENNLILNEINGKSNVAGICGNLRGDTTIKSSVIASKIISENPNILFGEYDTEGVFNLENIYYDKELTPIEDNDTIGLNTSQMQGNEALENMDLDFDNIWKANKEFYPMFEQLNSAPDIIPNDKVIDSTITINQYEEFNPTDYVTIEDFEGDEVTLNVINKDNVSKENSLANNNVIDTSKCGVFKIVYIATDEHGLSSELGLNIKVVMENPIINAEDVTIYVGDKFNPLDKVTAIDISGSDITEHIKVIENTVDTSKKGVYKVVYQVDSLERLSATKEIKVTVLEKEVGNNNNNNSNNNDNKVESDKNESSTTDKPQTGDTLFISISNILISILGLYIINRKKEL